eukprot:TRINITY_DN46592_c0_g1_i1.p1 TRINITY_DN46592_c0_g1~~TRINITY_DN46592_c0_g1_i1.p1  ORF type:complete len:473 (-),score=117.38 TRINITY_DN46592_c0_g1_i1:514-1728(-)
MGTLADAALAAGGRVVGVIPRFMRDLERAHQGLTRLVVVEDMQQRKAAMLRQGGCFVGLPGGIGTLEELLEALEWTCSGRYGGAPRPIGVLNLDGMYDPLLEMIDVAVRQGFLSPASLRYFVVADTPESLLEKLAGVAAALSAPGLAAAPAAESAVQADGAGSCIPNTLGAEAAGSSADAVANAGAQTVAVLAEASPGVRRLHEPSVEELARLLAADGSPILVGASGKSSGSRAGSSAALCDVFVRAAEGAGASVSCLPEMAEPLSISSSSSSSSSVPSTLVEAAPARHERKRLLLQRGAVFVALPGGVGVWEELLELLSGAQLGRHSRPLGLLNAGGFYEPLLRLLGQTVKCGFTEPQVLTYLVSAETPKDLLQKLRNYAPTRVVKMVRPAPHQLSAARRSAL